MSRLVGESLSISSRSVGQRAFGGPRCANRVRDYPDVEVVRGQMGPPSCGRHRPELVEALPSTSSTFPGAVCIGVVVPFYAFSSTAVAHRIHSWRRRRHASRRSTWRSRSIGRVATGSMGRRPLPAGGGADMRYIAPQRRQSLREGGGRGQLCGSSIGGAEPRGRNDGPTLRREVAHHFARIGLAQLGVRRKSAPVARLSPNLQTWSKPGRPTPDLGIRLRRRRCGQFRSRQARWGDFHSRARETCPMPSIGLAPVFGQHRRTALVVRIGEVGEQWAVRSSSLPGCRGEHVVDYITESWLGGAAYALPVGVRRRSSCRGLVAVLGATALAGPLHLGSRGCGTKGSLHSPCCRFPLERRGRAAF